MGCAFGISVTDVKSGTQVDRHHIADNVFISVHDDNEVAWDSKENTKANPPQKSMPTSQTNLTD